MIRISLDDLQARRLEQAFLQTIDRTVQNRLQVGRMAHLGRPHQDVADQGVCPRTVRCWFNTHPQGGFVALKPGKSKGHPLAITRQSVCKRCR